MSIGKVIGIGGLVIVTIMGLGWVLGWNNVLLTITIRKAQQTAEREVYEETQSYVEGKRQEAAKYYREYATAEESDKAVIKEVVANSFANFNEEKLDGKLRLFVYQCKYE